MTIAIATVVAVVAFFTGTVVGYAIACIDREEDDMVDRKMF